MVWVRGREGKARQRTRARGREVGRARTDRRTDARATHAQTDKRTDGAAPQAGAEPRPDEGPGGVSTQRGQSEGWYARTSRNLVEHDTESCACSEVSERKGARNWLGVASGWDLAAPASTRTRGGEPRTSSVRGRRPLIDSAPTMEAKALGRQRDGADCRLRMGGASGGAVMAVDKRMKLRRPR